MLKFPGGIPLVIGKRPDYSLATSRPHSRNIVLEPHHQLCHDRMSRQLALGL